MSIIEVSSHKTEDGNVVFSYRPVGFAKSLFGCCCILVVLIAIEWCIIRPVEIAFIASAVTILIGFFITLTLPLYIRNKRNDYIEKELISKHLKDQIEKDIHDIGDNVRENERKYIRRMSEDSMTYGKRNYVVALSDGQRLVYHVDNPQMLHKILQLEIKMQYESVPRGVDLDRVLQRISHDAHRAEARRRRDAARRIIPPSYS